MKTHGLPSQEVKEYYRQYWKPEGFMPRGRLHPDLAQILGKAVIGQRGRLLDMGCGDAGALGPWARERGWEYAGVDVSSEAVGLARQAGFDTKEIGEDFATGYPSKHFDLVCCFEVLEHLLNPRLCLQECLRVLKPGGKIVVTVPNVGFWRHRLDLMFLGRFNPNGDNLSLVEPWRDPHVRFFTLGSLGNLLRKTGVTQAYLNAYGGGFLSSAPFFHRWANPWKSGVLYRLLVAFRPSLFGAHLVGVAEKS